MKNKILAKLNYYVGLLPLGALFGLVVYIANLEVRDLDLWLHIGVGRYIVTHNVVPNFDFLSGTIAGTPWINHEWLFQVVVYNIFSSWGLDGLIKMQVVIVTMTMLILVIIGFSKEKQLTTTIMLLFVFMVYQQRFTIRPDLFSLLFFAIYIFILALHIDKRWASISLFIVQVLWTNMHGFFFFGPLFVMLGIISEWIKRHVPLPYEWNESGRLTDEEFKRLKWILIFVVGACFINPETIKGALYPLGVFFSLSGENKIFFKFIQELQVPITKATIFSTQKFIYYKMLILLSAVSFFFNRRRIDISALLFWLVFLIFSLKAIRNLTFFAFASYLVVVTNMLGMSYYDLVPVRFTAKRFEYLTLIVVKIFLLGWMFQYCATAASHGYYDFDKYEIKSNFGGVSLRNYPTKAVDFLVDNKVKGNFFNDFNSGAYLVGRAFPDIKVFIDGRTEVYGAEFFKKYQQIWEKGNEEIFVEMEQRFNLTGILLNSAQLHIPRPILKYMHNRKDWHLVYFDYDGLVFLKDVEKNKELIETFKINLADWQTKKLDVYKIGPAFVDPFPHYYRAYTLETLDFDDQALDELLEALKINPDYADANRLLGRVYAKRKDYEKAFESFRVASIGDPGNQEARVNLALAYHDLGHYDGAIREYQDVINIWPNQPKAYFFLAQTYAKNDQIDESLRVLRSGLVLAPKNDVDVGKIGDIILKAGNAERALEAYKLALQANDKSLVTHSRIAELYVSENDFENAKIHFQKALEIAPDDKDLIKKLNAVESDIEKSLKE